MAVAEDASTPAVARSAMASTSATLVSASFTPPLNAYLLVMAQVGLATAFTSGTAPTHLTISASGGVGTWSTVQFLADTVGFFDYSGMYLAQVTTSQAMTVTMTRPETGAAGLQLAVRVVTGSGGVGASSSAMVSSTTAQTNSLTPTATGSQLYASAAGNNAATFTANGSTTSIDLFDDTTDQDFLATGQATALTASLSAVTLGWTASVTEWSSFLMAEMVPSGAAGSVTVQRKPLPRVPRARASFW